MDEQDFNNNYNNETNNNDNNENNNSDSRDNNYTNNYRPYSEYPETGHTEETHRENVYQASSMFNEEKPKKEKKHKEKKQKTGNRFFPKLMASVAFGLAFGACAAGAFYGVDKLINKDSASVAQVETSADVASLQKQVEDLQNAVLTSTDSNGNTITTVVTSDVSSVVDKVMPSMVAVTNNGTETVSDWFGRSYTQETQSCGSGIIVGESDTEYFIATNHHVIEDNVTLSVLFVDDTSADAYVKGYDSSKDIAVIAVAKSSLSADTMAAIEVAELGDSDSLKIGEPAIAIGNALGYGQSVTTGVISALGRDMTIDDVTYENLIQTSAAINPGNSGGALLNSAGQVIGINSSKVGGSNVEGMGFAIPISEVKDIIEEFSARETRTKVSDDEKGYLGIGGNDSYDLTTLGYPAGVYVAKVYAGSPAEQAGIYMGDIITKVDGQSVTQISELSSFLSYYKSGETVTLTVTRNVSGTLTEMNIDVVLGTKDAIAE